MDRALYIAGTGARELMRRQDVQASNLANALTPGFRAEIAAQRTAPVVGGAGMPTRAYAVESTPGADLTPGALMATGRPLDVAVQGSGWFAVRAAGGEEAYTRAGNFAVSPDGMLVDHAGRPVLGVDGAPIAIPPDASVDVNPDGSISSVAANDRVTALVLGQLKLVDPAPGQLVRGGDGLFRLAGGAAAPADPGVRVAPGMLESSNVSAVETMVTMISAARHFDLQVQMMQNTEQNQRAADQLLSLS
ncbi:flagellar basal-body rod protein FlgF [Pigmentiphaga soli]|uniref:Flagellar basal-body rod protein FlgF n=1 Tax=Pigmentiphaga soli TaxID=1007095 RepID=A0ABP8GPD2_9BURK